MEIRQNQAVQGDRGTRKGASGGSACILEGQEKARVFTLTWGSFLEARVLVHGPVLTPVLAHG